MALTALPNMERVISGSKPPLPLYITGVTKNLFSRQRRRLEKLAVFSMSYFLFFSKMNLHTSREQGLRKEWKKN